MSKPVSPQNAWPLRRKALYLGVVIASLVSACKSLQEKPDDPQVKACKAQEGYTWRDGTCHEPAPGYITQSACAAIRGAEWRGGACQLPRSSADCSRTGDGLAYDGYGCVAQNEPPNFFRLCQAGKGPEEAMRTVSALMAAYGEGPCQEVFDKLKVAVTLSLTGERLSDLSPLAGLGRLRSLNVWNNRIADASALAGLPGLVSLNIGHNQLTSLRGIDQLSQLTTLIISENQLSDAAAFQSLTKLQYLDVSQNRIADLAPLKARSFPRGYFDEGNTK